MQDKDFNTVFQEFLQKGLSYEDIAGMYVICNEREQKQREENAELKKENEKLNAKLSELKEKIEGSHTDCKTCSKTFQDSCEDVCYSEILRESRITGGE